MLTINDNETPPAAGSLQFATATYTVAENGGTAANINVSRTGGSTGAVSVSYATSDDTATAGSDYTASSGTLNWADGDTASKTFSVAITNDSAVEGNETVNLTLSNVTGGAALGSPNNAILTITDDDGPVTGPSISGITPSTAKVGDTITISGANFGATQGSSTVTVGGIAGTPATWSSNAITLPVPTGVATGPASVVVTVGGQTATGSITITDGNVNPNAIIIDDFEGGCVGTWQAPNLNSGYYAFGTGVTPDNTSITASGPSTSAAKNGSRGMNVRYSYVNGWGGGWGAKLIRTLDLTNMTRLSLNVRWDGSTNDMKVGLKDSDGTAIVATVPNSVLANLGGYNEVSIDRAQFAYDQGGSDATADSTFDWTQVVSYNIIYPTQGTSSNYQYIDDITAVTGGQPPIDGDGPVINSINPGSAPTGASIVVSGLRFGTSQGSSSLQFTNLTTRTTYQAQITSWSDTAINAIVPAVAPIGSYEVVVNKLTIVQGAVTAQQSNPAAFAITSSGVETAHVYPNPFDPNHEVINIVFTQPAGATNIGIYIYDMTARLVSKTNISTGQTTWNGLDQNGQLVGDGAYLLRVVNEETKTLIAKAKILVVKK